MNTNTSAVPSSIAAYIKRHPLVTYFVTAYVFTWLSIPLLLVDLALGVFGLLMPAVAAILVVWLSEGKPGVRRLLHPLSLWRLHPLWYGVALGLPMLLSIVTVALTGLAGRPVQLETSQLSPLVVVIFVMVVGEEIGWRGFALPRLLQRYSPVTASLLLGVLWACWHAPMFLIPGTPMFDIPVPAYFLWVVALSFLFTWLYQRTQGSLLLATLFHGAVNALGVMNSAISLAEWRWWLAGVYLAVALTIVLLTHWMLGRQSSEQDRTTSALSSNK
jgi:membrane protease YdiL (CAAX protease family)